MKGPLMKLFIYIWIGRQLAKMYVAVAEPQTALSSKLALTLSWNLNCEGFTSASRSLLLEQTCSTNNHSLVNKELIWKVHPSMYWQITDNLFLICNYIGWQT